MGHNVLAEKLDQISEADLGIQFDPNITWERVNSRLTIEKYQTERKLLLVACFTLLILLAPISFLKQTRSDIDQPINTQTATAVQTDVVSPTMQEENVPDPLVKEQLPVIRVNRKEFVNMIADVPHIRLNPQPEISTEQIAVRQLFTNKDISIIQASLEEPRIEFGRKMSVRAQLYTPSIHSKDDSQNLKIKLYEKGN